MSHMNEESTSHFEQLPADMADVADMDAMLRSDAAGQRGAMRADLVDRIAAVTTPMLQGAGGPAIKLHEPREQGGEREVAGAIGSGRAGRGHAHRRWVWAGLAMAACAAIAMIVLPASVRRDSREIAGAIDPVAEMDLLMAAVDAMDQHAVMPALGSDGGAGLENVSDEDLLPLVEIGGSL